MPSVICLLRNIIIFSFQKQTVSSPPLSNAKAKQVVEKSYSQDFWPCEPPFGE